MFWKRASDKTPAVRHQPILQATLERVASLGLRSLSEAHAIGLGFAVDGGCESVLGEAEVKKTTYLHDARTRRLAAYLAWHVTRVVISRDFPPLAERDAAERAMSDDMWAVARTLFQVDGEVLVAIEMTEKLEAEPYDTLNFAMKKLAVFDYLLGIDSDIPSEDLADAVKRVMHYGLAESTAIDEYGAALQAAMKEQHGR